MSSEDSSLTSAVAILASINQELMQMEEQNRQDEQRMRFLVNADTARLDFYEIRSQKNEEVRRIIINSEADIIFDSESKVKIDSASELPDFDEIDTKFSHVIPDTKHGRDYYRRLRGLQPLPKVSKELPRHEREEMHQKSSKAAKEEARELRRVIVDNFREQDDMERQSEINEISMRSELHAQQEAGLQVEKERLQLALMELHKEKKEEELRRKQEQEASHELKRKEECLRKRNAWLDGLSNRTHTAGERCAMDVDHKMNSIDLETHQQPQTNEEHCIDSDTSTSGNDAKKLSEDLTDSDEDRLESGVDFRSRACSLKDECARSDASTCDDFQ